MACFLVKQIIGTKNDGTCETDKEINSSFLLKRIIWINFCKSKATLCHNERKTFFNKDLLNFSFNKPSEFEVVSYCWDGLEVELHVFGKEVLGIFFCRREKSNFFQSNCIGILEECFYQISMYLVGHDVWVIPLALPLIRRMLAQHFLLKLE